MAGKTDWQRGFRAGFDSNRLTATQALEAARMAREDAARTNAMLTDALMESERRADALLDHLDTLAMHAHRVPLEAIVRLLTLEKNYDHYDTCMAALYDVRGWRVARSGGTVRCLCVGIYRVDVHSGMAAAQLVAHNEMLSGAVPRHRQSSAIFC